MIGIGRLAVLVLTTMFFAPACTSDEKPPSIVFILIDTLRFDYLGCYGFEGPISPHVDRIAETAHLFQRAYAQAPWTKPSVASLFTSLYPTDHGVVNHEGAIWGTGTPDIEKGILVGSVTTLAEVLFDAGYATAAFVANPWITRDYGFDQGFEVFGDQDVGSNIASDRILSQAYSWMDSRDPDAPFFMYLHFMDVHGPYLAPDSCYLEISNSRGLGDNRPLTQIELNKIPVHLRKGDWVSVWEDAVNLNTWRGRYGAGMKSLDHALGVLMAYLEERGILDSAYLIITSDHGEELLEHGEWGHGQNLYEHQIRVPLIIRPPGGLKQGQRHGELVRLIDLMPTLITVADAGLPEGLEGMDLSALLEGRETSLPEASFSCASTFDPALVALNVDRYKIIMNARLDTLVVFDTEEDPAELHDIAVTHPVLARELEETLNQIVKTRAEQELFTGSSTPVSQERLEQLRALGYIN